MTPDINRRKLLSAGGAALAVGLAGCSAFADGRGVPGTEGGIQDGAGDSGPDENVPTEAHEYLTENEANLYEGSMEDMTGQDAVTIMNGAGTGFAFDPPLVQIDPGTEVTWEWTGEGGAHNVSSTEPSATEFRSGDPMIEGTWSHTFEEAGFQSYHCEPHSGSGMHGAIVVGEADAGGGDGGGDATGNETEDGGGGAENGTE